MTHLCPHCGQAMEVPPPPNGIIVDGSARRFGRAGKWVNLTKCEWGIFSALLRSGGEVVSGVEIDESVWPGQAKMGVNVMERRRVFVHRLRAKFHAVGLTITNERGHGYKLEEVAT